MFGRECEELQDDDDFELNPRTPPQPVKWFE
jgi:hypothetical protein